MVKNLPAVQETWVRSLGWEDPLEKEMATHSNALAWRIPMNKELDGLQFVGSQKVRQKKACQAVCTSLYPSQNSITTLIIPWSPESLMLPEFIHPELLWLYCRIIRLEGGVAKEWSRRMRNSTPRLSGTGQDFSCCKNFK